MKKLVALASMALLLCASASFAKQAMDEEEMDLVTAAGQPSVIFVTVETEGIGELQSTTNAEAAVVTDDATALATPFVAATAFEFNAGLSIGDLNIVTPAPFDITVEDAQAAINLDFASAAIGPIATLTGTLTATSSASASSSFTGASASVTATNDDNSVISLIVDTNSQTDLTALVLNNVAGENQIGNGINVKSSAFEAAGSQDNTISQSWGSTFDWSAEAGSPGGAGGTATGSSGNCAIGPCNVNDANGGNASSPIPLTIQADKITRVDVESTGNAIVDVSELNNSVVLALIDTGSQTNLAALIVNNVTGRNQVASGINVTASGSVVIGPGLNFGVPTGNASTLSSATQSNTITQSRGTVQ